MYVNQHTIENMGTARLLAANAGAYENYLSMFFGREWRMAGPAKIKGINRLRVRFSPERVASGDATGPFIVLWVEYNPAMGLHTVWGEYWGKEDATEPEYKSSPRSGYDNEMLSDPSRVFDWLDASVTMGEASKHRLALVCEGMTGFVTPAGPFIDGSMVATPDGFALEFEPEMRMPKEYFVSGTRFPGMTGPDEADYGMSCGGDEWWSSYASPVRSSVQLALDTLYGVGSFKAEVDVDGYVLVTPNLSVPPQNFENRKSVTKPEDRTWYEDAVLRMAGVGGHERLQDRMLSEAKKGQAKKSAPPFSGKRSKRDQKAFDALVADLKAQKKAGASIRDPEALAGWIGLRMAGKKGGSKRAQESSESLSTITERVRSFLRKEKT
jgi:hypothetical protein